MWKNIIFKKAFLALAITGILNWVSYKLYLYWTVWWIDMVVHFFGGLTVGLTITWLMSLNRDFSMSKVSRILTAVILGTIFVGVLWEIFELYFQITSLADGINYWTDTTSDLIMDTLGGIFAWFYTTYLFKKLAVDKTKF